MLPWKEKIVLCGSHLSSSHNCFYGLWDLICGWYLLTCPKDRKINEKPLQSEGTLYLALLLIISSYLLVWWGIVLHYQNLFLWLSSWHSETVYCYFTSNTTLAVDFIFVVIFHSHTHTHSCTITKVTFYVQIATWKYGCWLTRFTYSYSLSDLHLYGSLRNAQFKIFN